MSGISLQNKPTETNAPAPSLFGSLSGTATPALSSQTPTTTPTTAPTSLFALAATALTATEAQKPAPSLSLFN